MNESKKFNITKWKCYEPDLEGIYNYEELKDIYNKQIDKDSQDGYSDFDSWLYDMEKLGIFVKEDKEKMEELKEKYVKTYTETDYGYHNNATMIYGQLNDGNYYVYIPDNDVIDIYNEPITEKFIDTSYNYDTDDEKADDEWYNKFVEEHQITKNYNTDDLNLIISELDHKYFGEDLMGSEELNESENTNIYKVYQYEVGILLKEDAEEYNSYKNVWDKNHAYYDEDWGVFADYEDAKTYVDNYVKDGVVNTYGIISEITVDKDLYSDTLNQDDNHHAMDSDMFYEMDYNPTYIIYSIYKNDNNELVQNFISLNQEKQEKIEEESKEVKTENLDKIKYNIYILEGEDGVYNSQLIDTVDSEEQAEDRVAELSAETGSNAYYKKVINGKEEDSILNDELEESKDIENKQLFSGIKFEKRIPHTMRFKQYDVLTENNEYTLYWITQQFFGEEELNEFIKALKEAKIFNKAYVTVRDLSTYKFEEDLENNVLVKIELDTGIKLPYVDATGYQEAMKDKYKFDYKTGEWKD